MKKRIILCFLLIFLFILSACSNDKNKVDSPLYDGKKLTIGVVGKIPKVHEKNVGFKKIGFKNLQGDLSSKFNAVFIMGEKGIDFSKEPYTKIYKNAGIPYFYIKPQKYIIPSVDSEIVEVSGDEDTSNSKSGDYVVGFYQFKKHVTYWKFGLFNDTENKENIMDVYSRIFKAIEILENKK